MEASVLNTLLWAEKYRPQTIEDCILPEETKKKMRNIVDSGNMTHMIFHGTQGTGKTTLAKVLKNEFNCDLREYNGSNGSLNMEELRTGIEDFAHTSSLNSNAPFKIVLIDEADGLGHLVQPALRNLIEKYSSSCRFIMTCNEYGKILPALKSRCSSIDFNFSKEQLNETIKTFAHRVTTILDQENVTYSTDVLITMMQEYYPDNRRILNELQAYSNLNGCIDDGIFNHITSGLDELFAMINAKNFDGIKSYINDNMGPTIYGDLWREYEKHLPKNQWPIFIMCIAEAAKHDGAVPNKELNLMSSIVNFMLQAASVGG